LDNPREKVSLQLPLDELGSLHRHTVEVGGDTLTLETGCVSFPGWMSSLSNRAVGLTGCSLMPASSERIMSPADTAKGTI